jgi:hypothetical protein
MLWNVVANKLITWSSVLEKLTVTRLVKKFPAFYGTQRFITMLTRTCWWNATVEKIIIINTSNNTIILKVHNTCSVLINEKTHL